MIGLAEAQRVHHGDGARAHGEDVAHDAAHAGGRALIGLDEAGMVVGFHLEDAGIAVADIDHAGILARALDHPGRLGGQLPQMGAGGFVGAMLAPHHGEDAQLHQIGVAAQQALDAGIFLVREAMLADQFGRDGGHDRASIKLWNRARPSVPPVMGSTIRSGWGIRPSTLRFGLRMPAMSRAEPLGLS